MSNAKHEGSHEARRQRAEQGLPIDVADPATLERYQALKRTQPGPEAAKPKPASKGKTKPR